MYTHKKESIEDHVIGILLMDWFSKREVSNIYYHFIKKQKKIKFIHEEGYSPRIGLPKIELIKMIPGVNNAINRLDKLGFLDKKETIKLFKRNRNGKDEVYKSKRIRFRFSPFNLFVSLNPQFKNSKKLENLLNDVFRKELIYAKIIAEYSLEEIYYSIIRYLLNEYLEGNKVISKKSFDYLIKLLDSESRRTYEIIKQRLRI